MARQVKCPKCGTQQEFSDNCVKCNMDFKAYAQQLKAKRVAAAGGKKMVKCPKCGKPQPLSDNCVNCNMDFKAYARQLKAKRAASAAQQQGGAQPKPAPKAAPASTSKPAPSTGGPGLRDLGELFNDSWDIYKGRFGTLLGLYFLTIIFMFAPMFVAAIIGAISMVLGPTVGAIMMSLTTLTGMLAGFALMSMAMAGLIAAVADDTLGVKAALGVGRQKMWSFAWVVMGLLPMILMGGYMLFIIPGLIFGIWFFFSQFIVVLEPERGLSAMLKSKAYARGHWWGILGRLLIMSVVLNLLGITVIGAFVAMPYFFIMMYLMYVDLRTEKGDDVAYPLGGWARKKWVVLAVAGLLLPVVLAALAGLAGFNQARSQFGTLGMSDIDMSSQGNPSYSSGGGGSYEGSPVVTTDKDNYQVGEVVWVDYSGMPGNETDWISIMPASSSDSSYRDGSWHYLKGNTSGQEPLSNLEPGHYEIRLYYDWNGGGGYNVRARTQFTVEGAGMTEPAIPSGVSGEAMLLLDQYDFEPAKPISISFMAPEGLAGNAWVGIIPSHIPHGSESENDKYDITYQYLNGRTAGTLTFNAPMEPGAYDFRMHDTDTNGKEIASVTFMVVGRLDQPSSPASNSGLRPITGDSPGTRGVAHSAWMYIYSVNYKGRVLVNGHEVKVIEGERDMQYNYNFSAELMQGNNNIEVIYESLPDSGMLKMQIEATDAQSNQPLGNWTIDDAGGTKTFDVYIP